MLKGRKIILAVSGGIAAYKSAFLVRLLVKSGAEVQVIMTDSAVEFITPLTLATLSRRKVLSQLIADKDSGEWNNHVDLGLWADLMIIAPATANTLSKMANGGCDNLLQAVYLSARCPVMFAPAMDLDMWKHPATKQNISLLLDRGNLMIAPGNGELASGLSGEGRMAEPEEILSVIENHFKAAAQLKGKKVLITAGPTYEAIDPVRFIGNYSSGKMGIELAKRASELGADVTLICGPSAVETPESIARIDVVTAEEMLKAALKYFSKTDIAILSAAVADYRPAKVAARKIKKSTAGLELKLEPTPDILKTLGGKKNKSQLLIGFALETNDELANAKKKLQSKNLDYIVLNSLNDHGAGFAVDTNKITILGKGNKMRSFELKSKRDVARDIFDFILKK